MPTKLIRPLSVICQFEPFGLSVEPACSKGEKWSALREQNGDWMCDADDNEGGGSGTEVAQDCYCLFDSESIRERGGGLEHVATGASCWDHDEELFIHGNTIVWSAGHQVRKRFSSSTTVIQAKWCRLEAMREPLLCVLHSDSLTTYTPSGAMNSVPFQFSVESIWSLPCGLLLQRAVDSSPLVSSEATHVMGSPLAAREWYREGFREGVLPGSGNKISPLTHNSVGGLSNRRTSVISPLTPIPVSSLFTLQHPLEEPQPVQVEEGGKLHSISDMEEKIIWTSSEAPYVATYHTGRRQHSVWLVKAAPSDSCLAQTGPDMHGKNRHAWESPGTVCLQRAWVEKGGHPQANQIFLATDEDGVPILCMVVEERQKLFSFRLYSQGVSQDLAINLRLEVAWTIDAVSAAPVVATRPRFKNRGLPHFDLLTLSPDGNLLLHTGKYLVCEYYLPYAAVQNLKLLPGARDAAQQARGPVAPRGSSGVQREETDPVVGLRDAVKGRVNVVTESGKVYRCAVGLTPSSAITVLCINALAEGLRPSVYRYLLGRLLDREFAVSEALHVPTAKPDGKPDIGWAAFSALITELIRDMPGEVCVPKKGKRAKESISSWDFLLQSSMHQSNLANLRYSGLPLPQMPGLVDTLPLPGPSLPDYDDSKTAVYFSVMVEILEVLHAVYEDCKLDTLRWRELWQLAASLSSLAAAAGELDYVDHYARDFPTAVPAMPKLSDPKSLRNEGRAPSNLLQWLANCLKGRGMAENSESLPGLLKKDPTNCVDWSRKVVAFFELLMGGQVSGRQLQSGVHISLATGSATSPEQRTVLAMVAEGFGLPDLDRLPPGVSLPLRHALNRCREAPPGDWPRHAYVLIGREDLASTPVAHSTDPKIVPQIGEMLPVNSSVGLRTTADDVWMAAPYILHLRPVPILPASSDPHEFADPDVQAAGGMEALLSDGMEYIFTTSTPLRFGRDLRLNEVRRLLGSSKPVAVRTANSPDVSDPDIVAQQQAQLWLLAQRTTALSFGRGAFTLATSRPLLTEALPIPKLVLAGRLPSQHDATVNLDANTGNLADITSWPEFHNGVAASLRLAPGQAKITRTWIVYNKPDEPNFAHAGLLMALGLHKHLGVLAATDVYRYLAQEHEATTVGVLLGMAAAHRGTMDPAISKILYLHIPARHPPSFPELELPTLMQSAALMAVGLLYQGSAHRLTTEILLAEIGRKPGGDNALDREGYALAAGLALGLVTLGRGRDAYGLADLHIEDRLRHYMSGGSEPTDDRQKRFDGTVSTSAIPSASRSLDDQSQSGGQVMEGSMVNLDVTAPGATLALALMFLKTNCEVVAARLAIPDTHFALEYVRPDFILLRLVARSLILWDSVQATEEWIQNQVPDIMKEAIASSSQGAGAPEMPLNTDADMEALAQAHVNILAGACLSIGLRYAGTASAEAQQLLHHYALYFLSEKRAAAPLGGTTSPSGHRAYVDRGTLETCLNVAVLSLSVVMAGTGHLETFRLLRYLRRRNDSDGAITFGNHMAISMAIGFLFLGGGGLTFATNNGAVAALLIALYPRYPTAPNDHRCHLQAFRHLYALATEARCLQTVDVDTSLPVYTPIEITLKESAFYSETTFCRVTPCILPERSSLKRVRVCGPRYWPQVIELPATEQPWWEPGDAEGGPFNGGVLYVKRKVGALSYADDPIGCRSLLSRALHKDSEDTSQETLGNVMGRGRHSKVDQLVSTFSADPSMLAFARLFCSGSDEKLGGEFGDFCLLALFECVSTDRPALLQTYLALYTAVEALVDRATGRGTSISSICSDSLSIYSLKVAVAYCDVLGQEEGGSLVQRTFLAALAKRIDDVLSNPQVFHSDTPTAQSKPYLSELYFYLDTGQRPFDSRQGGAQANARRKATSPQENQIQMVLFACYLCWYGIPRPRLVSTALQQLARELPGFQSFTLSDLNSALPLLALVLPGTPMPALLQINECLPFLSLNTFK